MEDWAWWDEPYFFLRGENQDFLERNVNTDSLSNINIHLFVLLNRSGTLVYNGKFLPSATGGEAVSPELLETIASHPELTDIYRGKSGSGLLLLPEGPAVIAYAPVLDSNTGGDPAGIMVMGRYLNFGELDRLSKIVGFPLSISWSGEPGLNRDQESILSSEWTKDSVTVIMHNGTVSGYMKLPDMNNKTVLIGLNMPMDLYNRGLATVYMTLLFFIFFGILVITLFAYILDRFILLRLQTLTDEVNSLGTGIRETPEPVLTGDDELSLLERAILTKHSDLITSEDRLRAFIDSLTDPAFILSPDGTIFLANQAAASTAGMPAQILTGKKISDLQGLTGIIDSGKLDQVIKSRKGIHFEETSGGRSLFVSAHPVIDQTGRVEQIVFLTGDLTERRRTETALMRATKKISVLDSFILKDIQNQLFVLTGYQKLALDKAGDSDTRAFLKKGEDAAVKIQEQLAFAKQYREMGTSPPKWQNVNQVLLFAISHLKTTGIVNEFALDGMELYADMLLERVFSTLIGDALGERGPITAIRAGWKTDGDDCILFIEDDGIGIPADAKDALFEKPEESRSGLGFFLASEILSITDMTIRETGNPLSGARFEIVIPRGGFRFSSSSESVSG